MLILNSNDVCRALPMADAVAGMKSAFAALSAGHADVPARAHLDAPDHAGLTLVMPARRNDDHPGLTVKAASVFEQNPDRGLPRIQAAVLVLEPKTGTPVAVLEGSTLTAIRTAAASGAATDLLARPESSRLAIIGAGAEARTHLAAMCAVRPIREVCVYSRTREKAVAWIEKTRPPEFAALDMRVTDSPGQAIQQADIVCATTSSATPVFSDGNMPHGVHINAIGSFKPHVVEIPAETVVRSRVVVDSREAAWEEAGDLIQPREAGLIDEDHVLAELGELVTRNVTIRQNDEQITLFKSVGVAIQDTVAAQIAVENAQRDGLGQAVDW